MAKFHERETMGAWACPIVTINVLLTILDCHLTGIWGVFDFTFGSKYPCYLFLSTVLFWLFEL